MGAISMNLPAISLPAGFRRGCDLPAVTSGSGGWPVLLGARPPIARQFEHGDGQVIEQSRWLA